MSEESGTLYVGIDLGTARSAISTSGGERHLLDSYVGWPLDMVARKVLGREVLIGREALEARAMLDLHRPLERGLIKEGSERDSEAILQLLARLLELGGVEEARRQGTAVRAVVGVPSEALRVNRQHLRQVMNGLVDSLMIVTEPFAVAYGLDALVHALVVDMGAGTTDFCVMNGRFPTEDEQRTLPNAGDWVDSQLSKLFHEQHRDARASIHSIRKWKEAWSFVGHPERPVRVTVPIQGRPRELEITEQMRTACESLVPPISETMRDLISTADMEFQEKIRHSIFLAGGCSAIRGLAEHLERSLAELGGGKVRVVEDPAFAGCDGGLALAQDAPTVDWERLSA